LLNIGGKYKRHVNVIIFYKPDLFEVRKDHRIFTVQNHDSPKPLSRITAEISWET